MKKFLLVLAAFCLLAGAGFFLYNRSSKDTPPPVETKPEPTKPVPVRSEETVVPEPSVTSGYVIGVVSVSKSINGEIIKLKVTNDGSETLQLDPNKQFKLVGLKSNEERLPIAAKTTTDFAGPLAKNEERTGSVTFDTFAEENSELRFYPDAAQTAYIVVPLITLPSEQP